MALAEHDRGMALRETRDGLARPDGVGSDSGAASVTSWPAARRHGRELAVADAGPRRQGPRGGRHVGRQEQDSAHAAHSRSGPRGAPTRREPDSVLVLCT